MTSAEIRQCMECENEVSYENYVLADSCGKGDSNDIHPC